MKQKRSQPAHVECSAGRDVRYEDECVKVELLQKDPSKLQVQTPADASFKWATDHVSYQDFLKYEKAQTQKAISKATEHQPSNAASMKKRIETLLQPFYKLRTKRTLVHLLQGIRTEPNKDTSDRETLRLTLLEMVPKSIALNAIALAFDYIALNTDDSEDEDMIDEEVEEEVEEEEEDED